jgi:hypothetical protein
MDFGTPMYGTGYGYGGGYGGGCGMGYGANRFGGQ